ncbi:hypothetical protein A2397_01990 [Candidatus Amesbacteria bacterium RIFOXYB1_FULL_44_23]|uniref:HEPN domain-containing protein n=1 Tax=Candidatus Amesbacteria bacterium RIFOXYB1_FULL_44_23 TaxID=1797263 RepID=A0A1F4ZSN8_9BACT|nr:MAG: hypothetical protein A2397_01990 [Candidatus Amesbacteria bacterium RIFOXYB1_FULL_44_23]
MTKRQVWQTIALDLKRAANYLHAKRYRQAEFYLDEAKQLYKTASFDDKMRSVEKFISFSGDPEGILLGSSIISGRL